MYPRLVKSRIEETLEDTRVVLLVGPRQSGKTTLAEEIARKSDMAFMSLDDPTSSKPPRPIPWVFSGASTGSSSTRFNAPRN